MGNKKGLAAIFSKPKPKLDGSASPPWPWPSCANSPATASFRWMAAADDDHRQCTTATPGRLLPRQAAGDMYRTVNSVYFDPAADSCFSFIDYEDEEDDGDEEEEALDDDDCVSFSTTTASEEWSEAVIRSLRRSCSSSTTDRFFFDDSGPPPASNSILAASRSPSLSPSPGRKLVARSLEPDTDPTAAAVVAMRDDDAEGDGVNSEGEEPEPPPSSSSTTSALVEESVAVALDSSDPYRDFRASMEEMVAAHGLRDWAALQELLSWYLRINATHNHALIVRAFVDLLAGGIATTSSGGSRSCATTTTATTTTTMTTTTTAATTSSGSSSSSTTSSIAGDGGEGATCSTGADHQEHEAEPVRRRKASGDLALHVKLCT